LGDLDALQRGDSRGYRGVYVYVVGEEVGVLEGDGGVNRHSVHVVIAGDGRNVVEPHPHAVARGDGHQVEVVIAVQVAKARAAGEFTGGYRGRHIVFGEDPCAIVEEEIVIGFIFVDHEDVQVAVIVDVAQDAVAVVDGGVFPL